MMTFYIFILLSKKHPGPDWEYIHHPRASFVLSSLERIFKTNYHCTAFIFKLFFIFKKCEFWRGGELAWYYFGHLYWDVEIAPNKTDTTLY